METKTKTTKTKVPVQDKKVIDAHRSLLSKTEASEQQLRKLLAIEVQSIHASLHNSSCYLRENIVDDIRLDVKSLENKIKAEFTRTFKPVVVLFAITILLQFAILVN